MSTVRHLDFTRWAIHEVVLWHITWPFSFFKSCTELKISTREKSILFLTLMAIGPPGGVFSSRPSAVFAFFLSSAPPQRSEISCDVQQLSPLMPGDKLEKACVQLPIDGRAIQL